MKKNILVVYHSRTGNTKKIVDWFCEGVERECDTCLQVKTADETDIKDILNSDGIVIATPENFGSMSGKMKDFFERTYYPSRELNILKPFVLLISCETDGLGTERQICSIANGYTLRKVLYSIIVKNSENDVRKQEIIEAGHTFAAGIVSNIF